MNRSGDSTRPKYAVDPATFRAQATGIGQSQAMSRETGAARAACVAAQMPPAQRAAVPVAEGYPSGAGYGTSTPLCGATAMRGRRANG